MLKSWHLPAIMTALLFHTGGASAADYSDPTWPCIQRKVEALSPGLMWQYPLPETAPDDDIRGAVDKLADTLALRRIELDTLRPAVEAFAARHDGDPAILGHVFARSFNTLDKRRTRIIRGIGDFSLGQIALSEQIDATRLEMDTLLAAAEPDFDRIDELEEKLDWDQVIFTDRSQSITYICETPQLIERRLFGIAQMLASVAKDPS